MPQTRKKTFLAAAFVLSFYFAITLWRFSFSPMAPHPDGYWYHLVARNWAQGKGLVESCILYFYPAPDAVIHPVSCVWNPLSYFILGVSYKAFGISTWVARVPVLATDGILTLLVLFFCLRIYRDYGIAVLSALTFAAHKFVIGMRAAGGAAENFHMLFVTLFCLSLGAAFKKDRYFYLSAFLIALAYLTRNESVWGIPVLILVFLYRRRTGGEERPSWKVLGGSVLFFAAAVAPWEIRNRIVYGASAGWAKYSLLFARDYYDLWSCSLKPNGLAWFIGHYLDLGLAKILVIKLQSYYYKLDTTVQILSWPVVALTLSGLARNLRERAYWPAYAYATVTYLTMGFLNSMGQGAGWHAPGTLLAFAVPLAVSGGYHFGSSVTSDQKKARLIGLALGVCLLCYQVGDSYKQYRLLSKIGFRDQHREYSMKVAEYFKGKPGDAVILTHNPQYIHFYTGIPTVQIPTNEPLENVEAVMRKYRVTHLVLCGSIPPVFAKLYEGTEALPGYRLVADPVVPDGIQIEGAGARVKIFEINLDGKGN